MEQVFSITVPLDQFPLSWREPKGVDRARQGLRKLRKGLRTLFASKSDYMELKFLDHAFNDGTFTAVAVYFALCTTIPTDASLGTNIVEANYTTYARLAIGAADMSAASAGSKTNTATFTFAACTAGSSTIVGFAIVDSITIGAGNIHYWGTTTSKVIDTTSTPPTIAAAALVVTED